MKYSIHIVGPDINAQVTISGPADLKIVQTIIDEVRKKIEGEPINFSDQ
jgi:hypothetical protein